MSSLEDLLLSVNQVSRLSLRTAPFARKLRCLHFCLHNQVRVLSNNLSHLCVFQSLRYFLF